MSKFSIDWCFTCVSAYIKLSKRWHKKEDLLFAKAFIKFAQEHNNWSLKQPRSEGTPDYIFLMDISQFLEELPYTPKAKDWWWIRPLLQDNFHNTIHIKSFSILHDDGAMLEICFKEKK